MTFKTGNLLGDSADLSNSYFQKGFDVQESIQEVTEVISLVNSGEKTAIGIHSPEIPLNNGPSQVIRSCYYELCTYSFEHCCQKTSI